MDPTELIHSIDEKGSLEFLAAMVRHKSYSQTEGERELASFMVERMRELGLEAELQQVEGERVNAIGRWRGEGNGRSLLFNGHVDTNPATEGWTVDPWGGLVDDKFIYGIGVSNMKAGDAAYYWAVKTLIDAGVKLKGDVILSFVVGELQGGVGTLAMLRHGIRADFFINAEPTDLQALTMHAAAFTFIIELVGVTRHLSKREEAVDAIVAACDLVPRLNAMTFAGASSEEHRSINRCHVGVLHGALGKDLAERRPPATRRLREDQRLCPLCPGAEDEKQVLDDMRGVLRDLESRFPGLQARLTPEHLVGRPMMPTFEVVRSRPSSGRSTTLSERVRGARQPTGAIRPPGSYGTDAAHLRHTGGMEGVVCGPGGRYNTMPDERVDVVDFLDMIRVYLLAILDICNPTTAGVKP